MIKINRSQNGIFEIEKNGVRKILLTNDEKVEFIYFENKTIAFIRSKLGYPAYYPVNELKIEKPIKAVLMDLDGTSVHSEGFWMWIIQLTISSLIENSSFKFEEVDLPFISGHSVSEHLQYCINKYCPGKTVEEARKYYYQHTEREMKKVAEGKGRVDAFKVASGLKDFLLKLKSKNVKIALVTSGLYQKVYPEILAAFRQMNFKEKPEDFYDSIVTAGFSIKKGAVGTLGELQAKPHPWLYAEACKIGLGIPFSQRHSVVGIEDSGAGVCAINLAGFSAIGKKGGNIEESGTLSMCKHYSNSFEEIYNLII